MAKCEKCGKEVPEGTIYCGSCALLLDPTTLKKQKTDMKAISDEKLFEFKRTRKSRWLFLFRIIPIMIGLVGVISGSVTILHDVFTITIPFYLIPGLVTIYMIISMLWIGRKAKLDKTLMLAAFSLFLSLGFLALSMEFVFEPVNLQLNVAILGILLASMTLILNFFRSSKRNYTLFGALIVGVLTLTIGILLELFRNTIFAVGVIISGICITLSKFSHLK